MVTFRSKLKKTWPEGKIENPRIVYSWWMYQFYMTWSSSLYTHELFLMNPLLTTRNSRPKITALSGTVPRKKEGKVVHNYFSKVPYTFLSFWGLLYVYNYIYIYIYIIYAMLYSWLEAKGHLPQWRQVFPRTPSCSRRRQWMKHRELAPQPQREDPNLPGLKVWLGNKQTLGKKLKSVTIGENGNWTCGLWFMIEFWLNIRWRFGCIMGISRASSCKAHEK